MVKPASLDPDIDPRCEATRNQRNNSMQQISRASHIGFKVNGAHF
jgi:hypothetical protein